LRDEEREDTLEIITTQESRKSTIRTRLDNEGRRGGADEGDGWQVRAREHDGKHAEVTGEIMAGITRVNV